MLIPIIIAVVVTLIVVMPVTYFVTVSKLKNDANSKIGNADVKAREIIDDAYIRNFIDSRKDKKSRREIYALLRQKGVDMNRAEEIMEEMYEVHSDQEAIRELLRKKHWDFACTDPKEKQKIYGYLVRKGFRYEDIRQVIQVCDWNA